jgi:Flagellar hook-length control protein FliK
MEVTAVVPVSLERLQALSLNDAAREGHILEAKVEAMLNSNLARIAVAGHSLNVATPRPLPVGAYLTLRAEHDGGQLRLVTQGPIRGGEMSAPPAVQGPPPNLLDPVKAVLSKIQAMTVEATLAQGAPGSAPAAGQGGATPAPATAVLPQAPAGAPPQVAQLGSMLAEQALAEALMPENPRPTATATPPPAQQSSQTGMPPAGGGAALLAELLETKPPAQTAPLVPILAERALVQALRPEGTPVTGPSVPPGVAQAQAAAVPAGLPHQAGLVPGTPSGHPVALAAALAAEASEARAQNTALSDALAAYAATDTSPAATRAERLPVLFSFEIPLYFPGNQAPLRLEVEHDQHREDEDGKPLPPSWTIRFDAEAGPLGMIHAAITQVDERIGVQLWAERGQTAALFQDSAGELQTALVASNLKLEALTIAEGKPAEPQHEHEPQERRL